MAQSIDETLDDMSAVFDRSRLRALSREIAEVMFDWQETSTMERPIDARLLEKVSRILHRCEQRSDQIREAEDLLMHMDEPDLGIALLRQAFLIRSEPTEQSIIRQLGRLSRSQDSKTSSLTQDALKEAAYSEVPRLQNVGCKALFLSDLLSDVELQAFARSEDIQFQHRLEAVRQLAKRQTPLASSALMDVVRSWGALRADERKKHEGTLREAARSFEGLATLDKEALDEIIDELFTQVDGRGLTNDQKKLLQMTLAEFPERTVEYIESLGTDRMGSPAVIFTLGTCARRSSRATWALLQHAVKLCDSPVIDSRALQWTAIQLKLAKHENDRELHNALQELISSIQHIDSFYDGGQTVAEFEEVQTSWARTNRRRDCMSLLSVMTLAFEDDQQVNDSDAYDLRFEFERARQRPGVARLDDVEQEVLVQTLQITSERNPWISSAFWLIDQYRHFEGYGRIVVQEALGYVGLGERGEIETNRFRKIREFFEHWVQNGSVAEQQHAGEWLDRLVGERPPSAPQG